MAPDELRALESFHSDDASMRHCLDLARVAAKTSLPVLILGESGTGKTLLAQAIHESSKRSSAPFVSFNAAALSETLLDSQLFGHEKGAFTNANRQVKGKFELADKGTLFLDEIADMTLGAQAKILRAIEYGEFSRLGSEEILIADVRLISATHLPLHQLIESNKFRRDLFYRLSGFTITIPPLRERPNDLRTLIASEIKRCALREGKEVTGVTREALEKLQSHDWPGNLRELNRVMHIAVAVTEKSILDADSILIDQGSQALAQNGIEEGAAAVVAALDDLSLRAAETGHILRVLELLNGNKRQAAKTLGISRSTLDRKLEECGIA